LRWNINSIKMSKVRVGYEDVFIAHVADANNIHE
jgi:hypothetical protein